MERAEQLKRTARMFLGLALGLSVLGLYVLAAVNLIRWGPLTHEPGWTSVRKHDGWYVQSVDATGAAGGKLQTGDRILTVDGVERFSRIQPDLKLRFLGAAQTYSLRINRGGVDHEYHLEFPPASHNRNFVWTLSLCITGLVFYAVGMLMGLSRPGYSLTRLGCIASLTTATHVGGLLLRSVPDVPGRRHSANLPRTGTYPINTVITNLVAAIIPLTLAYAVIKHRVLGISVVLRRSLQYLLAKQSLRLFLLLPLVLLASGIVAGAVMSDMGADPQLRSSY